MSQTSSMGALRRDAIKSQASLKGVAEVTYLDLCMCLEGGIGTG